LIAVRLQLGAHGAAGSPGLARASAEHAEQVLHVVAVFVRQHVGLSERATARAEARSQLVEEAEIDVDVLVERAVERPDLGAGRTTARVGRTAEEDGLRETVAAAAGGEFGPPVALHAVDVT